MEAEMTEHLGHEKNAPVENRVGNTRNGSYPKKVKGEFGNLDITVEGSISFGSSAIFMLFL